jgi:hypothetical protein
MHVQAKKVLVDKYSLSDQCSRHADAHEFLGMLSDALATRFWTLVYVFSSRSLLADFRLDAYALLTLDDIPGPNQLIRIQSVHLNLSRLKQNFPRFHLNWQSYFRIISARINPFPKTQPWTMTSSTSATESLQIPGPVTHLDPKICGADVAEFKPRRFTSANQITAELTIWSVRTRI